MNMNDVFGKKNDSKYLKHRDLPEAGIAALIHDVTEVTFHGQEEV